MEHAAGYLYVISTINDANLRYCRTSLSAGLTGYPPLQIANWENQHTDNAYGDAAQEVGKLIGTLKALEAIPEAQDDSLVLVVDGEDTWFQLRPEILIKRYREINKEAETRVRSRLGTGYVQGGIENNLVFAAQRKCHSRSPDHISCYAAPESPLKASTFGPSSFQHSSDSSDIKDPRPRYLNAQMMLGTARALRKLHLTAWDRWGKKKTGWSSRASLFAEMFGEQEYAREMLRSQYNPTPSHWFSLSKSKLSFVKAHPEPATNIRYKEKDYELGITLDYHSSLAQVPNNDAAWIRYSDPITLLRAAEALKQTTPPSHKIQRDIEYSRPPFWSLAPMVPSLEQDFEVPKEMSWETMQLYTNLHTGITPALILSSKDTPPEKLQDQWKQMWFQPYARTKLTILAYEPTYPLTSEHIQPLPPPSSTLPHLKTQNPTTPPASHSVISKTWWSPINISPINKDREGFGFVVKDGEWRRWNVECKKEDQEAVLGDGKGSWVDRKVYPPYDDVEKEED